MFKKKHEELPKRRKRKSVGFGRLLISMVMICILGLGVLQAVKGFSGLDPLNISPKSIGKDLLNSDSVTNFITGVLSFNPSSLKNIASGNKPQTPEAGSSAKSTESPKPQATPRPKFAFEFALIADSHVDGSNMAKAVSQVNQTDSKFVIGLGDYSDVGTVDELRASKHQFDLLKMPYYAVPGDHDLWDSLNRNLPGATDYLTVFGKNYQSFVYQNIGFILIDDSNNYDGIDNTQKAWILSTLQQYNQQNLKDIFIFTHIPFYHPSSDHTMGKADPDLVKQADYYTSLFKSENVTEVFAGDIHFFSEYTEPKTGLKMMTDGAVTSDRNLEDSRFATVDVFTDGSYTITDTPIK